ncbi:MAG TPA: LysM peptidoglycan-binding domain-containing protein [Candidatus Pelethenecus faecipullorum]|uniref:LysM peptidoglycan-binding domain-containing protein n=1 Tax=Candidatus Pelethenecus faecipullorum TaxID=2840900 RepID=A0A9D1KHV4_9MOLU|nr:LysM peptidoglycan-binding domain-containing protein [Candidatus Pelethenecus faecipullorum]
MIIHIVKNEETIEDILRMYHLERKEIEMANLHLTDFDHLSVGTKIKIPLLTEEVEQILEHTESFVMDYYPQVEEIRASKEEMPKQQEEKEADEIKEEVLKKEERNPFPSKMQKGRAYPGILPPKSKYRGI